MDGKTNILDVIPHLEDDITMTTRNGNTVLSFLSFRRRSLPLLRRLSKRTKLELDAIGSAAVMLIDGDKDVRTIIEGLKETFADEKQLDERTIMFLTELKRRKIIKYLAQ